MLGGLLSFFQLLQAVADRFQFGIQVKKLVAHIQDNFQAFFINAGYCVLSLTVMGAILGKF